MFTLLFGLSAWSYDLDVSESVLEQRIAIIEREYKQKYSDAKEQLKNDTRLTVDAILRYNEKP